MFFKKISLRISSDIDVDRRGITWLLRRSRGVLEFPIGEKRIRKRIRW